MVWKGHNVCCIIIITGLFGKRKNQTMIIKRIREKEVVEIIK